MSRGSSTFRQKFRASFYEWHNLKKKQISQILLVEVLPTSLKTTSFEKTFLLTEMFTVRHLFLPLLDSDLFRCVTLLPVLLCSSCLCFWPHGDSQDVHSIQNRCISLVENYHSEMSDGFITLQRLRWFQLKIRFKTEVAQKSFFKKTHWHTHLQNVKKDTAI